MIAYFDCFSGISGDMTLGALVDCGVPIEYLRDELAKLPIDGYRLSAEKVTSKGLQGTRIAVDLDADAEQPHRHLSDIVAIIDASPLPPEVKAKSKQVFLTLAEAEAHVHGTDVEHVHFHEVGAVDAIVDVVGSVIGLAFLNVDRVYASALPTGSGTVMTAHGLLPVPAPATLEILTRARAPLRPLDAKAELVTPTGAAILATLAEFRQPLISPRRIGHGFGRKELPWANCLRLWIGDDEASCHDESSDESRDEISVLEANIDDTTPELLGAALNRLIAAGSLDAYFTPIQMKKNRPAVMLTALSTPGQEGEIAAVILRETSTLGVRVTRARRFKAARRQTAVETPWGTVRVKVKSFEDRETGKPEYDDCLRLADEASIPIADVYNAAQAAFLAPRGDDRPYTGAKVP